jgi:choline dehydrogenase-like flavoprotein
VRGYNFQFNRTIGICTEAITAEANGLLPWGDGHHDAFRGLVGHRMSVGICTEDLPEEHNRVTLDPVLKDRHGISAPRVDYTIGENTNRMLDFAIDRGKEILAAAGARHVNVVRPVVYGGWHLLGTARMGNDPQRSVVNSWGRSHDVRNLFIVDGSIFVTSGGVNPTCTIQALALYVADSIKQRLATLFD